MNDALKRFDFETRVLARPRAYGGIPSPAWFRHCWPQDAQTGHVDDTGHVKFCAGHHVAPDEFRPGMEVRVWFDLATQDVLIAKECDWRDAVRRQEEAALKARAERDAADAARTAAAKAESDAWVTLFAPPFAWRLGHRQVLSGLRERSYGDGRNRASVEHIMFSEDFSSGRLSRKAGDLLCTSAPASFGNVFNSPGDDCGKPTCKSCLEMAARFMEPAAEPDTPAAPSP